MCRENNKSMNKNNNKASLGLVFTLMLLMATFVFVQVKVFDLFDNKSDSFRASKVEEKWGEIEDIKAAKGMYQILKEDKVYHPTFIDKSVEVRTLKGFREIRAYPGAPPMIPHLITKSKSLTGDSCLGCHKNGGFTPKFNAYAPVVPHPEKRNCRQCHNPVNEKDLFKDTKWKNNIAKRGHSHLPGSPLTIPHSLQMRENCLSCHSGPASIKEIRTTHPERVQCMQCHVEAKTNERWSQI